MTLSPLSPSGSRYGPYTILRPLTHGGTADIYLARKDGTNDVVVIKKLREQMAAHSTAGKRLHREAHLASLLDHPNIAKVIDAGFIDETFFLAMELVAGETLGAILDDVNRKGDRLPPPIAIAVIISVLDALEHAHELAHDGRHAGFVHRDLAPRNIIVGNGGVVKVIDFGAARAVIDDFRTAPGMLVGTLLYMSPEQVRADPVDRRSDLYTVGAVLYELLAGRPSVRHGSAPEVAASILEADPMPLRSIDPGIAPELEQVVMRALAKDPARRWANAAEMRGAIMGAFGARLATIDEIGRYLQARFPKKEQHVGTMVVRLSREEHVPTRIESAPAARAEVRPVSRRARSERSAVSVVVSRRRRYLAPILAAVAVVIGGAALTFRQKPADDPTDPPAAATPSDPIVTARGRGSAEGLGDPKASTLERSGDPGSEKRPPRTPARRDVRPEPPIAEAASPPPDATRPPPPRRDPMNGMLAEVEASPDDASRFLALSARIEAEAAALPEERRARIIETLDRANMTLDPALLAKALRELQLSRARR
jgi:serine/threonine-protein kinase